ncbi:MAG: thioredoxin family protein [Planctomycetes bacterium]|nr:thioredoxin family protein [Planctomycetota bacterium]
MDTKRKIEIFSAGCSVCEKTVKLVKDIACDSCQVSVLDMHDADVAKRAESFGIKTVPAVIIDGKVAKCCQGQGPDEVALRAAGLGHPL